MRSMKNNIFNLIQTTAFAYALTPSSDRNKKHQMVRNFAKRHINSEKRFKTSLSPSGDKNKNLKM